MASMSSWASLTADKVGTVKVQPAPRVRRSSKPRKTSHSDIIRMVDTVLETEPVMPTFQTHVHRVRLHMEEATKGVVDYLERTTTFLDGASLFEQFSPSLAYPRREWTMSAQPVRTQDVVDYGRLETAVKQFLMVAHQFSPKAPPSPAQLESMLLGYQNILEWRRLAREAMERAEGQIDLAEASLRQFLD